MNAEPRDESAVRGSHSAAAPLVRVSSLDPDDLGAGDSRASN